MGTRDVFDEMLRTNEVPNSPASGVESLAGGTHSERTIVQFRRQGANSGERHVEKAIVHFIGQNNQIVLYAEIANALELLA